MDVIIPEQELNHLTIDETIEFLRLCHASLKPGGKYAFDVVVVDPPRAGLHPAALEAVIGHAPRTIVYVSCNTATFARDLGALLKAGYDLRTVQPVDMFPHTAHIETVSVLQKH